MKPPTSAPLARVIRLVLAPASGGGTWVDLAGDEADDSPATRRRFMRDIGRIRAAGIAVRRTAKSRGEHCRYWIDRDCLPWGMRGRR